MLTFELAASPRTSSGLTIVNERAAAPAPAMNRRRLIRPEFLPAIEVLLCSDIS
jgi:hypothetical protein